MPDIKLTFGKYRDWTIDSVYRADPNYCRWLFTKSTMIPDDSDIKKYLSDKFKDDETDGYAMTFGKHKGKSVKWIHEHDEQYFHWLSRNDFVKESMPKLREEIEALLDQ